MAYAGDEVAKRPRDVAAAFHTQGGNTFSEGRLRRFPYARGKCTDIEFFIIGAVGDADAAAEVDELERNADRLLDLFCDNKNFARGIDHVLRVELVGYRHRVEAEATDAFFFGAAVSFEELFAR